MQGYYYYSWCDYVIPKTVNRYKEHLMGAFNVLSNDEILNEVIEEAILECTPDLCLECTDTGCAIDKIINDPSISGANLVVEEIKKSYIKLVLGVDDNFIDNTTNILDGLFSILLKDENEDICIDAETVTNVINDFDVPVNQDDYDACLVLEIIETLGGVNFDFGNPFSELNDCEKQLIKEYPACALSVFDNYITANLYTWQNIGNNTQNECSDAYRHAFFNALNSYYCGEAVATLFGHAHECVTSSQLATDMDLHNNSVGYSIIENNPNVTTFVGVNYSQLSAAVCEELENGNLQMFQDPNDNGDNTFIIPTTGCMCLN